MSEENKSVQPQKPSAPAVKENGQFEAVTLNDQLKIAQNFLDNGVISDTFKTPQQVVIGMQYAKEMGVSMIVALRQMFVLNGVPNLYGDGPLMLIQRTGQLESIEEFFIDEECSKICVANKNIKNPVYAAVCRVKRVGDPIWQEDTFSMDDLDKAGMHINKYGEKAVWKKYKRIMMRYKARSIALKSKFADLMNGIEVSEYHNEYSPEMPEINHPEQNNIDSESITKNLSEEKECVTDTIEVKDYTTNKTKEITEVRNATGATFNLNQG